MDIEVIRINAKSVPVYYFNKKYWPYQLYIPERDSIETAERFCYTNFKSRNWNNVETKFVFKRQEDYMFFALRWS